MIVGTTGTGLDHLVYLIVTDEGLAARIPASEIEAGARAADGMNKIIIEGIQALGIANDGRLTASDIRDLSAWIAANNENEFKTFHGDDDGETETGFHLVQNDGDAIDIFGRDAVDTVADGIYHLVFGYRDGRIINEDGNRNAELDELAWWLDELLEEELAAAAGGSGPLANLAVDPWAVVATDTGLDTITGIILDDPGLQHRIPTSEIQGGAQAGADIARMIVDEIENAGLANDGIITASDVYYINEAIRSDPVQLEQFIAFHGDDENGAETGFHLVQNDGALTRLYDTNAVNTVADGLYHIGFEVVKGRFQNEDGDANASVAKVAAWMQNLLREDLAQGNLSNAAADPVPDGTTGTGLDRLVQIIEEDTGLNQRISLREIAGGADSANTLNTLLRDAIIATGAANDGIIQTADMRDINSWLRADSDRLETFKLAHGDDEDGIETGFHRVQNDGANSRLFGENAVNTIADGIYHFGYEISRGRFLNEDGNANQSVEDVAAWVNELLSDADLKALANPSVTTQVSGTTGSGLDRLVRIIMSDPGLNDDIATSAIVAGAEAADALNQVILDGLIAVGAGQDGHISSSDVRAVNAWIQSDPARYAEFVALHGDDEEGIETGFHQVQHDGADTYLFNRNAVDTVADGIYHIGFDIEKNRFQNEDGNANASVSTVAEWLNGLLADDLAGGALYNPAYDPDLVDIDGINSGLVRSLASVTPDGSDGYVEQPDGPDLDLAAVTIMLNVTPATLKGQAGLFSRDGRGFQDGGHVTILRAGNDLKARVQTETSEEWLRVNDVFTTGESVNIALSLDGQVARLYVNGSLVDEEETTATWLNADEDITIGANAWAQNDAGDNRVKEVFDGTIGDMRIYNSALSAVEIQAVSGARPDVTLPDGLAGRDPLPDGTTGTGLDRLIEIITGDVGLDRRVSDADIAAGAAAADEMNGYIVEAIQATGVANDGVLTAGDVRDLSDWIAANRKAAFVTAHGDDEDSEETGFHLVQNDGAKTRIFGDNAVDTVADGLYHLPFGYRSDRIINEDGDNNQKLEDLAWWLEALLSDELAQAARGTGPLFNSTFDPTDVPLTGTGLDRIVEIIFTDPGIQKNVATTDAATAATAATGISQLILDGITRRGLVDDGDLTASDVRAINDYIRADEQRYAAFVEFHGDDEDNGDETGFHLVQNDGDTVDLFGDDALDTVADGIFHIGFEIENGRFRNEDGNRNASVERVAYWLSELLADEIADGGLKSALPLPGGTTGTGLDRLVEIVLSDRGLERKISELEIREGAAAADAIGHMIIEAIKATGVALNGEIKASDIYEINNHIRETSYEAFRKAHGDDEDGEGTGFHLVQHDGATTRLYSNNAVDKVADGIYHLGFEIKNGRLLNEHGNKNASVHTVAGWLDSLLTEADYVALAAAAETNPYVMGSTGTGLDLLVNTITEDDGLINRISTSHIRDGAGAAQAMNEIILAVIFETGVANDGDISAFDVLAINGAIREDAALLTRMTELHGNDEDGSETGFHRVQKDGARTELFDRNAVDKVADGIYHIGFEVEKGRFLDEDGRKNVSVETVAGWLSELLADDLASGALVNPDLLPEAVDLEAVRESEVLRLALDEALVVSKSMGELELTDITDFSLAEGTVFVRVTPEDAEEGGRDVFFSRDGRSFQDGGHLTMWMEHGDLVARFQTDKDEVLLRARDVIENGESYDVAFTFDGNLASLYLDGALLDVESSTATWLAADEPLVFGGSLMYRGENSTRIDDRFEGTIEAAYVFDSALGFVELQGVATADYQLLG